MGNGDATEQLHVCRAMPVIPIIDDQRSTSRVCSIGNDADMIWTRFRHRIHENNITGQPRIPSGELGRERDGQCFEVTLEENDLATHTSVFNRTVR